MISKGIKKYLINPSLGLLIGVLFLTFFYFTNNILYSFLVSIASSAIIDLFLRLCIKTNVCGFVFFTNLCTLLCTFVVWLFLRNSNFSDLFYLVIYEIILVSFLFLANLAKTYLMHLFGKTKNMVQKTYLGEFFEISKLTQYGITFHLFILLIYRYVTVDAELTNIYGVFFHFIIPILIFISIIIFEEIKIRNIVKHLRQEQWLPIVTESGEVTGRIARSVSVKMKNKYLHPVVRVAVIHNGELYLQKRPDKLIVDPLAYDHPFEKYMLFNHEINQTAKNVISQSLKSQELPITFLLKYVYETDKTKRLIFLFISRIESKEQLDSLHLLKGKFWTMKQIEDSFSDNDPFSECFQLEYEYLKNTVLQPELLKKKKNCGGSDQTANV